MYHLRQTPVDAIRKPPPRNTISIVLIGGRLNLPPAEQRNTAKGKPIRVDTLKIMATIWQRRIVKESKEKGSTVKGSITPP